MITVVIQEFEKEMETMGDYVNDQLLSCQTVNPKKKKNTEFL